MEGCLTFRDARVTPFQRYPGSIVICLDEIHCADLLKYALENMGGWIVQDNRISSSRLAFLVIPLSEHADHLPEHMSCSMLQ